MFAMESAEAWRALFENWPASVPRQGLLVTTFQESIPFVDYLVSESMVMVERDKPDGLGARKVIVAYQAISAVKLSSPAELATFAAMGFRAP
jgi:hypothetical protein